MNRPEDLILVDDIFHLPKSSLEVIVRELKLEVPDKTQDSYALAVWQYVNKANDRPLLTRFIRHIFAGHTSVTWYYPDNAILIKQVSEHLESEHQSYFEKPTYWKASELDSDRPYVVGAAKTVLGGDHVILMRFGLRIGYSKLNDGVSVERVPKVVWPVLLINLSHGCFEIKCRADVVKKVLPRVEDLVGVNESRLRLQSMAAFTERIEEVASALGGRLCGFNSKPDAYLKDMSISQAEAVVSILEAIDLSLNAPESVDVANAIQSARAQLMTNGDFAACPFSSLLLAGFQSIGFKAEESKDARDGPFYKFIRAHIQHHGGTIHFPVEEMDGQANIHSIKLGVTTNSVAFNSQATENAIRKIRNVLFKIEQQDVQEVS